MNKEKQRIAIAEIRGWVLHYDRDGDLDFTTTPEGRDLCGHYPNYDTDLNDMREAVMWLNEESNDAKGLAVRFCETLEGVLEDHSCCWIECAVPSVEQLAEAFLKTFDRWEEEP